jgi:hypothetical protein
MRLGFSPWEFPNIHRLASGSYIRHLWARQDVRVPRICPPLADAGLFTNYFFFFFLREPGAHSGGLRPIFGDSFEKSPERI